MKFLANENFPYPSIKVLRDNGLEVYSIGEESSGISDEVVLNRAVVEDLIILTFDRDYGERKVRRRIDHHDATGSAIPGQRRHDTGDRHVRILRHAHDLERALALRQRRRRLGEGLGQCRAQLQCAAAQRDTRGGHREFIATGAVEAGDAGRRFATRAVAVGVGIGGIEAGVLHLDEQHQVARTDGRRTTARTELDDRRAGRGTRDRRVIGIDDAARDGGGTIRTRNRADLGETRRREERQQRQRQPGSGIAARRSEPHGARESDRGTSHDHPSVSGMSGAGRASKQSTRAERARRD